jgi:hypothetical protein
MTDLEITPKTEVKLPLKMLFALLTPVIASTIWITTLLLDAKYNSSRDHQEMVQNNAILNNRIETLSIDINAKLEALRVGSISYAQFQHWVYIQEEKNRQANGSIIWSEVPAK